MVGSQGYVTREQAETIVTSYGAQVKDDSSFDSIGMLLVSVPNGEELNYVDIFTADPDVNMRNRIIITILIFKERVF